MRLPAPADLPPLDAAPFDGDVDGPPPDNALVAFVVPPTTAD
jgi:hypothetical protein